MNNVSSYRDSRTTLNVTKNPGTRIFKVVSAQGLVELGVKKGIPADVVGTIYSMATGANLSGSKANKGGKKSRRRPRRRMTRRKQFT
jgi:hypothetical protein